VPRSPQPKKQRIPQRHVWIKLFRFHHPSMQHTPPSDIPRACTPTEDRRERALGGRLFTPRHLAKLPNSRYPYRTLQCIAQFQATASRVAISSNRWSASRGRATLGVHLQQGRWARCRWRGSRAKSTARALLTQLDLRATRRQWGRGGEGRRPRRGAPTPSDGNGKLAANAPIGTW
jgi:hypothetical protein